VKQVRPGVDCCRGVWHKLSTLVVLAWCVLLTGCSYDVLPARASIPTLSLPAVLKLAPIRETVAGPFAQNAQQIAVAGILEDMLRSPEVKCFASEQGNLTTVVDLQTVLKDYPSNIAWALLCGFTLGLGPVNLQMDIEVTGNATVQMDNSLPVKQYYLKQLTHLNAWAYPPGLVTLFGLAGAQEQINTSMKESVASHLAEQLVKQVDADYRYLAAKKEDNCRLLAAMLQPTPTPAPVAAPVQPKPAIEETPLGAVAQRWAVIIGVSDYQKAGTAGLKNLRYAARDAQELYDRLIAAGPKVWPKENMVLLMDKDATKAKVADAVLVFLKKAQRDDVVLIFFSGHGSPDPDRAQNNYFLCHDTDPEKLTTTGFAMWEIDNALERGIIEAKRVVVMADACHSGGFAPEGMKDLSVVSRNVSEGIQKLGVHGTCRVVTSCEPGELSQEKADWGGGHGAFAQALVKGLSGSADSRQEKNSRGNEDGKIDLDELVHFVRREVGDLTSNAQHVQDTGRLNVTVMEK